MNEKNKFNWTNFLLSLNAVLVAGGVLLFLDGKSDIKIGIREVKDELKEVKADVRADIKEVMREQTNVKERLVKVETQIKEIEKK